MSYVSIRLVTIVPKILFCKRVPLRVQSSFGLQQQSFSPQSGTYFEFEKVSQQICRQRSGAKSKVETSFWSLNSLSRCFSPSTVDVFRNVHICCTRKGDLNEEAERKSHQTTSSPSEESKIIERFNQFKPEPLHNRKRVGCSLSSTSSSSFKRDRRMGISWVTTQGRSIVASSNRDNNFIKLSNETQPFPKNFQEWQRCIAFRAR